MHFVCQEFYKNVSQNLCLAKISLKYIFEHNCLQNAILHHSLSLFIKIATAFCDIFHSWNIL